MADKDNPCPDCGAELLQTAGHRRSHATAGGLSAHLNAPACPHRGARFMRKAAYNMTREHRHGGKLA
jgi:hypothetical protein